MKLTIDFNLVPRIRESVTTAVLHLYAFVACTWTPREDTQCAGAGAIEGCATYCHVRLVMFLWRAHLVFMPSLSSYTAATASHTDRTGTHIGKWRMGDMNSVLVIPENKERSFICFTLL
jgi:hypothetical protein